MQEKKKYLLTPIQAIRAGCIDCMGGYLKEVSVGTSDLHGHISYIVKV